MGALFVGSGWGAPGEGGQAPSSLKLGLGRGRSSEGSAPRPPYKPLRRVPALPLPGRVGGTLGSPRSEDASVLPGFGELAAGALLRQPWLAREIGGSRAGLADDVQVAVLGARPVAYVQDRLRGHCQLS